MPAAPTADKYPAVYPTKLLVPDVVTLGTVSAEVPVLRRRLQGAGWLLHGPAPAQAHTADEDFVQAVEEFQLAHDLEADGVIGPLTRKALPAPAGLDLLPVAGGRANIPTAPAGSQARQVIDVACQWINVEEFPPGYNRGPKLDLLLKPGLQALGFWDPAKPGVAWCAIAVCEWIHRGLNPPTSAEAVRPLGRYMAAARDARYPNLAWWGHKEGVLQYPMLDDTLIGSYFVMGRAGSGSDKSTGGRSGHAGLIIGIDFAAGAFVTVEGNVQDSVRVKERQPRELLGVVPWWKAPGLRVGAA